LLPTSYLGRVSLVLTAAAVFGVALSVIKGNGDGVRDAVGNLSAPWLLLPFLAGALLGRRRAATAAVAGWATCMVALAAFYLANVWVLDLGPHSLLTDVRLTFSAGRRYLLLGFVAGPVMGTVGGAWRRTGSTMLAMGAASTLLLEPFAWLAYQAGSRATYAYPRGVWAAEMILGAGLCAVVGRGNWRLSLRRS